MEIKASKPPRIIASFMIGEFKFEVNKFQEVTIGNAYDPTSFVLQMAKVLTGLLYEVDPNTDPTRVAYIDRRQLNETIPDSEEIQGDI